MTNKHASALAGPFRFPFLILNPACVLLGTATAMCSGSDINWLYFVLALIGAISAHISVNAFNEYDDFKTGLDFHTERTPFSGGSGGLPANPDKAHYGLIIAVVSLMVTALIGIFFIYVWGWEIMPLGVLGLIVIVTYTKWLTKNPLLCLIAPGLGFGVLMVMGTHFVLTGSYSWVSFVASLVPFFLVSDLLFLNQFPDIEADAAIGRKHLPILIGAKASRWVYVVFLICAYLTVIIGYLIGIFPIGSLLALVSIVVAVPTIRGVMKYFDSIPKLIPSMGGNVVINILTPVLLAIGLFCGTC